MTADLRSNLDPELHQIRSVARSLAGRERTDLEHARFALYAALETNDLDAAARWAKTCRVALLSLDGESEVREMALEALATIEHAIETAVRKLGRASRNRHARAVRP